MSLITYNSSVVLDFPLTNMDKSNKKRTKSIIETITVGDRTNLCGGLLKGTSIVLTISTL